MNDSFLEDLDLNLIAKEQKSQPHFNHHITVRGNYVSSTPQNSFQNLGDFNSNNNTSHQSNERLKPDRLKTNISDKQLNQKHSGKSGRNSSDSKYKSFKNKLTSINQDKLKSKSISNKENFKSFDSQKEKSSKESSACSDSSSKENNLPSDSPVMVRSQKDNSRGSDNMIKKPILNDSSDVTAFLNMVKDLIRTTTKSECSKVIKCLTELHIDSKANLLKQLFAQTDDILEELRPCEDTNRLRALVSENQSLREDVMILRMRNEELNKRIKEALLIKEENIELKTKLKELNK